MERNLKAKAVVKKSQNVISNSENDTSNILKFPSPTLSFTEPYFIDDAFEGKITLERVYINEEDYEGDADVIEISFTIAGERRMEIPIVSLDEPANSNEG